MKDNSRCILLIYTGGTIGMQKNTETGALESFDFENLLEKIPELKLLDCAIEHCSLKQPLDSSDIDLPIWQEIAGLIEKNYEGYFGFVVLHGSDTMSYTASALSFMLENLGKPVILTGSQLPIGDLRTDAKENLITAIQLAALANGSLPSIREVGLYFEYKLYRGNRTSKISASHFEAFTSPNFPPLAESGVELNVNAAKLFSPQQKKMRVHYAMRSDILIVHLFPGMDSGLISQLFKKTTYSGVLLQTFGSGNAPTAKWFLNLIEKTVASGIPVVNVTQCIWGKVEMGNYSTSTHLKRLGVVSARDMTTEAALCKMMYLLSQELTPAVFKTIFETSLRGECG
ncbi:MAG: type I asparaginase [Leeuwenhoekiella sp.]